MLKPLIWIGSSRSDLKELPNAAQDEAGYALYQVQLGFFPDNTKPLKGLPGVTEIVINHNKNTYRVIYSAKIGNAIYVLHVFHKKSKKGIKTPKIEIDLIKKRYHIAIMLLRSSK